MLYQTNFLGYYCKSGISFLHGGLLEIMLTVPFTDDLLELSEEINSIRKQKFLYTLWICLFPDNPVIWMRRNLGAFMITDRTHSRIEYLSDQIL